MHLSAKFLSRVTFITVIFLIAAIVIFGVIGALRVIFKPPPPVNEINNIVYRRKYIRVYLKKSSVIEKPGFNFGKLSEKEYFLDIDESTKRYE